MIELRGMKEYSNKYSKVQELPNEVQEQIKQILTILDESYGTVEERVFEGGKVILVEEQEEVEQVKATYNLKQNEFADEVQTNEGIYLMILVIFGTENSVMIVGKKEILQLYL